MALVDGVVTPSFNIRVVALPRTRCVSGCDCSNMRCCRKALTRYTRHWLCIQTCRWDRQDSHLPLREPCRYHPPVLAFCEPLAYADDAVIACPAAVATEYLRAWQDALAAKGLHLNTAKLQVWNPHDLPLPLEFVDAFPTLKSLRRDFACVAFPLIRRTSKTHMTSFLWALTASLKSSSARHVTARYNA